LIDASPSGGGIGPVFRVFRAAGPGNGTPHCLHNSPQSFSSRLMQMNWADLHKLDLAVNRVLITSSIVT